MKIIDRLLRLLPGHAFAIRHKGSRALRWGKWRVAFSWRSWIYAAGAHLRFEPGEPHTSIGLNLGWLNLYVSRDWCPDFFGKRDEYRGRSIGFSFGEWVLRIDPWHREDGWSKSDPWWWAVRIDFADLLLGEKRCWSVDGVPARDEVVMPEGRYPVDVSEGAIFHKRPRWFLQVWPSVKVDMPVPIPVPWKGENSWDCGSAEQPYDAISAMGVGAANRWKAMSEVRERVLEDRKRKGGAKWLPVPVPAGVLPIEAPKEAVS